MKRTWQQCIPGAKLGRWCVPQATLNRRGEIMLSRVAWELLGCSSHAVLLFDRACQTLGIQPARGLSKNAFPLIPRGRHGGRILAAPGIRYECLITIKKTIRFRDITLDQEGILLLNLATATKAYNSKRLGVKGSKSKPTATDIKV